MKTIELLESQIKKQRDGITGGLVVLSIFGIILFVSLLYRERPLKVETFLWPLFFGFLGITLIFRRIIGFQRDTLEILKNLKKENADQS